MRSCSRTTPPAGERLTPPRWGSNWIIRRTGYRSNTPASAPLARTPACRIESMRCFREPRSHHRKPRGSAYSATRSRRRNDRVDGQNVVPQVTRPRPDGEFCEQVRSGAWKGTRARHPERSQHRIGGSDSDCYGYEALALQPTRYVLSLRLQCRWTVSPRPFAIWTPLALFIVSPRLLRRWNHDHAQSPCLVAGGIGWRRNPLPAFSLPFRRMPKRCRSSASTPRTCSGFGIGSADALHGFGDWPLDHARHRPENFPRLARRIHQMDEHFRTAPFERISYARLCGHPVPTISFGPQTSPSAYVQTSNGSPPIPQLTMEATQHVNTEATNQSRHQPGSTGKRGPTDQHPSIN